MKRARSGHAAILLQDGRVLVAGGTVADGTVTNSAEIYDPTSNTWTSVLNGMNTARSGETATLLNDGRVLIAAGQSTSGPTNTLEIYSPASNSFTLASGGLSSPRQQHASALLQDGRVLIAGGSDGLKSLSSADIFDPSSDVVSSAGAMSAARAGLSATTLLDGTVLLAGGNDGTKDLASVDIYNPTTPGFSAAGALGAARSGHLAFLLPNNNQVLIAGGTAAGTTLQSVELFTPWTGAFAFAAPMSTPRSSTVGSALQQDGQLLVGTGANGSGALSSTEVYSFATVKTDQVDYAPGTTVNISGAGWQPGETVALTLIESPLFDTHGPFTAVADSNGNIFNSQFATDSHDVGIRFYLTAAGSLSNAQMTFTDGAANVTFTTDSPCAVTVTATYTNNGGKLISNQSLTTGTNAATVGTNPGSNVTYTYPSSISCSTQTYTFVSATPASPFSSNADSSPTTVQAHYVPAGTPAAISSSNNTIFIIGAASSFTVTATGSPTPTLTESGALPAGVSFNMSTGALSGTPAPGTSGAYSISFTASNGVGTNAVQNFTLVVSQASTTTQLTSVSLSATYVQSTALTLTATVAANSPSTATVSEGTVTFTVNTLPVTTVTGALSNGSANANLSVNGINAGTYSIAATYNPATSSPNFNTSTAGNQGTLTVGKANATISVTPYSVTYDGNAHTASASAKGVNGEDLTSTLNLSGTAHTNAGDYPSDGWSFTGGTNYNDATGTVHDAIAKATPQVTATGGTSVYNGAPQAGACVVSPTTLTVTPGYAPGPGAPVNAGTYTLTCSVAASTNYNANSSTAAITITPAAPVLPPAQTGSSTYGTSVTLSVTISPVSGGETPTGSVQFQFTSNNTTFNICSDGSLQTQPGATPCAITLDSTGTAKVTTSKLPAGTTADAVTATYNPGNGNYSGGATSINYTVSQASTNTTVSVTPATGATYGDTVTLAATVSNSTQNSTGTPTGTAQFQYSTDGTNWTNIGNPVTLDGSGNAQSTTTALPAGSPTIRLCYSGDANFMKSNSGPTVYAVNQKALTVSGITASDKPYDGTTAAKVDVSKAQLSGVVGSDDVQLVTGGAAGTFADPNAGTGKTVTVNGLTLTGTPASNYKLTPPTATASITQVTVTITASSATVTYGDPVPSITPTYSGFVNNEGSSVLSMQPTCTTTYTASSNAGSAQTTSCSGAAATNYTFKYVNGTVAVNKANATISVTPYSVTYDGNAHTASASAKGVRGEDLTSALNLSGTTHTNAGDYLSDGWSFTGGTNYNDATGTVHDAIAKATPQVTAAGGTFVYNGGPEPGTCAVSPTTLTVTASYAPGSGAPVNAGAYALTCSVAATTNYNPNSAQAAITISPAVTAVNLQSSLSTNANPVVVTLTATVTPMIGGNVSFTDKSTGKSLGTTQPNSSGVATLTVNTLALGQHLIVATYDAANNLNYIGSSSAPNSNAPSSGAVTTPLLSNNVFAASGANSVNLAATYSGTAKYAAWSFLNGDGLASGYSTGSVTNSASSGTASGSMIFATPNVYTIYVTVDDGQGGIDIADTAPGGLLAQAVIYDPTAGFVTGGGWINSMQGSLVGSTLSGQASFGFISKYQKGANQPTGNTEFNFHVANFDFKSTSYQWLVVSGTQAQYKGTGTINNGTTVYNFLLTAQSSSPNGFRIKITDSSSNVFYDNMLGYNSVNAGNDNLGNTQPIGGGSIQIQSK